MELFSVFRYLLLYHILLSASVLIGTRGVLLETIDTDHDGFSMELIHYDSPRSPFYVASETPADRALKAIRRSLSRLSYFRTSPLSSTAHPPSSSPPNYVSTLKPGMVDNEYSMTIHIGTPPVKRFVIADTGSGLNWVQCKPCKVCYKRRYPLFDPRKSSTYRVLNCKTDLCKDLPRGFKSCGVHGQCRHNYSYLDTSVTQGEVAIETFTFVTTKKTRLVRIPNVALGCGYHNQGNFPSDAAGLVGLGLSKTSLVTRIGRHIGWRFSHCLVPHTLPNASSILSFGKSATVTGHGAVSLPYFPLLGTVYAANLTKIRIGKKSIHFARNESSVILDTGTHIAALPRRVVKKMIYAVAAILGDEIVDDPNGTFVLCYPLVHSMESKLPSMTFEFVGGNVPVGHSNMFKKVSHNVTCLAVVGQDGVGLLGNLFMVNHKYGYDLKHKTITIAPSDCTKHE